MITDEQGREWLLQMFYNNGWCYCARDNFGSLYLTNEKPAMCDDVDEINISSCNNIINIAAINDIFHELKRNECINIAEELGIVDWSKVAVDTPVLVSKTGDDWGNRYFAYFKNGRIYTWMSGRTSWSADDANDVMDWKYVKLAEV